MKKLLTGLLLVLGISAALAGQQIRSMEFRNQEIRDILLTLGDLNGVSIVPDETVDGRASYVFSNMDFEEALGTFLSAFRLSYFKKSNVYYVSRISLSAKDSGRVDLSAADQPIKTILRSLSAALGKTILYDNIPNDPITLNVRDATLDEILRIITARYPDFTVVKEDQFYYIKNRSSAPGTPAAATGTEVTRAGDAYSLKIEKGRFRDLLKSLFDKAGIQYLQLMDRDVLLENIAVSDKPFEDILKVLLLNGNADFSVQDGVYYIYEVQRKDLMKRFLTNVILPFEHISSADFLRLLPSNLNSGTVFRLDEKGNKIILSGSSEEIRPLWDFITLIDKPQAGHPPVVVELGYVKTDELLPLLPAEFANFVPQALPGKTALLVQLPPSKLEGFLQFVKTVDRPAAGYPIRLRFLKSDELFARLPPSVVEANLARSTEPSLVFFKGSLLQRQAFLRDLEEIDRPRPQIRYEILVLQFEDGKGFSFENQVKAAGNNGERGMALSGSLGQLMNLSFDVISGFGYSFGLALTTALSNSSAKVVADTTLNGLSGEKIAFQNTNTFRYQDTVINPDTGKPSTTGIVRELSSGLILSLEGWISADNMITVKVDTTLSKKGSDGTSGTPPSTTEKKITTQVRTPSGKPLVISGLKQEDFSVNVQKVPLLGDIPWLGELFQKRNESLQRTEFSIYIIPVLERPDRREASEDDLLRAYYRRLGPGL